jgi:MFS transporter, DHA1 family, multidrug resistance protein
MAFRGLFKLWPELQEAQRAVLVTSIVLVAVSMFCLDAYIPALPYMTKDFVEMTATQVRLTVTVFFVGYIFMPFFYGQISDNYGRLAVVKMGMILAIMGCVEVAACQTLSQIYFGRFLQGAGCAAGVSVGRSMLRDVFTGTQLMVVGSDYVMVLMLAPMLAPLFGAYILNYSDWRMIFWILSGLFLVILLFVIAYCPETNTKMQKGKFTLSEAWKEYTYLLQYGAFMRIIFVAGMPPMMVAVYLNCAPFIYQARFGLGVISFGWVSVVVGIVTGISFIVDHLLKKRYNSCVWTLRLIRFGLFLYFSSGAYLLVLDYFNQLTPVLFTVGIVIMLSGSGFLVGEALSFACSLVDRSRYGVLSALSVVITSVMSVATTAVVSHFEEQAIHVLALVFVIYGLFGLAVSFRLPKLSQQNGDDEFKVLDQLFVY